MSIRISEGGRLFDIMAGVGGAAMIGSTGLVWKEGFFLKPNYNGYFVVLRGGALGRAMLVLGLIVIAGATTFIGLGSRRIRMTAGVVVVLAGAAGLIILMLSGDPRRLAGWPVPARCGHPTVTPCIDYLYDRSGVFLAGWGSVLAVGYGIVALLRSRGEAPVPAAGRSPVAPSDAARSLDSATPHKPRTSDAGLFGWTLVGLVIALVVFFFVLFAAIVSDPFYN
jgi:hypothetical protein